MNATNLYKLLRANRNARMDTRNIIAAPVCALMLFMSSAGLGQEDEGESPPQQPTTPNQHLQTSGQRWQNMGAADLQPSWNSPMAHTRALKLNKLTTRQVRARKNAFKRLRAAHASDEGPKPAKSVTVLGERNGITYGFWKSGPAGTMRIRHYHKSHHSTVPDTQPSSDFKGVLRRSAKIWSRRLVDDGRSYDVTLLDGADGTEGTVVKKVRGIVIQTQLHNINSAAAARVLDYDDGGVDQGHYRPYNGRIRISMHLHDNLHDGMPQTVAHEIGHILGVSSKGTELFEKYYDSETHTWTGPNAVRANGGQPVPMQWVGEDAWWKVMEPHAEGARRDKGHIGLCVSIMAYCNPRSETGAPSELDFAFLKDLGFTVIDKKTAAKPERYGYTSWGKWAVWGASVERELENNLHSSEKVKDFMQGRADAFGTPPDTRLSDNPLLTGTVVWKGSLHGVDMRSERMFPVVGKAKLSVDLATLAGIASFTDLTRHVHGNSVLKTKGRIKAFRKSRLRYAIEVTGNGFTDVDNRIQGNFYGPTHQEMAGIINDTRSSVNLLAGFGGTRIEQ